MFLLTAFSVSEETEFGTIFENSELFRTRQNAKVLSAGRSTSSDLSGPLASTVTIMVTTEESAKLQLASSTGALSLALRGDDDPVETSDNRTVTIDSVLGVLPAQTPQAIPSEGTVKVGGKSFIIVNGKLVPESKLTDK
jgi:Flp pilus assembly protein CpaB